MARIVPSSGSVTGLLLAGRAGDAAALARLTVLVHDELRRIARRCVRGESPDDLQVTALVNEAYLKLVDTQQMNWQNRAHFLAMAARLMRRILVDSARARQYRKRGGGTILVSFTEAMCVPDRAEDLVALDEALSALARFDERRSRVVELRFFGGLSVEETAAVLRMSPETVMRDWKLARTWLRRELRR
jgi:RNA polymerase sigma factor (TIGR02999 family)